MLVCVAKCVHLYVGVCVWVDLSVAGKGNYECAQVDIVVCLWGGVSLCKRTVAAVVKVGIGDACLGVYV